MLIICLIYHFWQNDEKKNIKIKKLILAYPLENSVKVNYLLIYYVTCYHTGCSLYYAAHVIAVNITVDCLVHVNRSIPWKLEQLINVDCLVHVNRSIPWKHAVFKISAGYISSWRLKNKQKEKGIIEEQQFFDQINLMGNE